MSLGYITTDFSVHGERENARTIFLCAEEMLPNEIPENTLFISKPKATLNDFGELFLVFEESWSKFEGNFVVFGLGSYDISKPEKELVLNKKTNEFDYFPAPNRKNTKVLLSINTLIQSLRDFMKVNKIVMSGRD